MVVRQPLTVEGWVELAGRVPEATSFHHPSWAGLLAETYGFNAFVLARMRGDAVVCGVPCLDVSRFGRRRWAALPFTDYCPVLAEDAAELPGFIEDVAELARSERIGQVELRSLAPGAVPLGRGAVRHELTLTSDTDALFNGFHRSQVQRNIRKAERAGVQVRRAEERATLVDVFFRLHVATRRRLGSPVQPRRYFRLLWERIVEPGLGFVLVAELDGTPAAAAVFLTWNGTTIYKYGASDARHWSSRPNHALFWEAIRWAAGNGYHAFDFGRSELSQDGLRQFKSGWGADEHPLEYSAVGDRIRPSGTGQPRWLETVIRRSPPIVCRAVGELAYRYAA